MAGKWGLGHRSSPSPSWGGQTSREDAVRWGRAAAPSPSEELLGSTPFPADRLGRRGCKEWGLVLQGPSWLKPHGQCGQNVPFAGSNGWAFIPGAPLLPPFHLGQPDLLDRNHRKRDTKLRVPPLGGPWGLVTPPPTSPQGGRRSSFPSLPLRSRNLPLLPSE